MFKTAQHIIVFSCLIVGIHSCNSIFDYSPFDVNVSSSELNAKNIKSIIAKDSISSDTVQFAVISDTHCNYDELKDVINNINKQNSLSFVICCGDITNRGTASEFQWYWNQAKKSDYPIITVIGNHDYLANGKLVYTRMFGDSNFTFQVGSYNFVVFDDVVWENDNKSPDFNWLKQQFPEKKHNILITHIPEWLNEVDEYQQQFDSILNKNNLIAAIYGHLHINKDTIRNDIPRYLIGDIADRQFALVSLVNSSITLKRISY